MGRSTQLSEVERGKVAAYRESGMTLRDIAALLNRSKRLGYSQPKFKRKLWKTEK